MHFLDDENSVSVLFLSQDDSNQQMKKQFETFYLNALRGASWIGADWITKVTNHQSGNKSLSITCIYV